MNVVERQLVYLIGREAATKIIENPNLFVMSVPANLREELREGTVMVVPVGNLCGDCDKVQLDNTCTCGYTIVETVTAEGVYHQLKVPYRKELELDD